MIAKGQAQWQNKEKHPLLRWDIDSSLGISTCFLALSFSFFLFLIHVYLLLKRLDDTAIIQAPPK